MGCSPAMASYSTTKVPEEVFIHSFIFSTVHSKINLYLSFLLLRAKTKYYTARSNYRVWPLQTLINKIHSLLKDVVNATIIIFVFLLQQQAIL